MDEFRKGWGPLLAAMIGTMCGLITLTNYSQGFFVGPVTEEFGWTKAQFFFGFTLMMLAGLVTSPIIGSLADKYGARMLGIAGLIGHSLAYVLISLNPGSLPLWYASFLLLAVLAAGSQPIIWTKVINGWFVKNRGKAIGITMAGTGIGALILPPIVESIIATEGWRAGYRAIGIGAALFALPFIIMLFREPKPETSGDWQPTEPVAGWGYTADEAMKDQKFWVLGSVLFLTVFVVVGILANFERILGAEGIDRPTIAGIAAVLGGTVVIGRLLIGVLVDRFWAPGVGIVFFSLPIVAILLLLNIEITPATALFVAVTLGLAAGAELDLLAFLTSRYFGTAHYGAIFGRIFAFFTVGAGIAPPLFGAVADATGGYDRMLTISAGILGLCLVLFMMLGKYPDNAKTELAHA
ncbi:MAG: MFS transporter [Parasphingorhabdus sp.]